MNAALVRLALRRTLTPGFALCALALAFLLVRSAWAPDEQVKQALAPEGDPRAAVSALARHGVWIGLLLVLAPYLAARAAATIPAWRRGEVEWLAASAAGRARIVLSVWLGQVAAALVFALFAGTAAELAAGPARPGRALAARYASASFVLSEGSPAQVLRIDAEPAPAGAVLRARLDYFGAGTAAEVRLALRRADSLMATEVRAALGAPGALEVALPAGEGPLEVVLERGAGEALVTLEPDGLELLVPIASERLASASVALRAWLALCVTLALGLGLGAWLSAPTACLGLLAIVVPALLSPSEAARLSPWSGLARTLSLCGQNLTAGPPSVRSLAAAAVLGLLGLLLAVAGLRTWRRVA